MSRFLSNKYCDLKAYIPGEQPEENFNLLKLNTNESPFLPSFKAFDFAKKYQRSLNLYPDPTCSKLREKLAQIYEVAKEEIIVTNGSDELLNFSFMAFCDKEKMAAFPDITYGFYKVFADLNNIRYKEIPLDNNFNINIDDYLNINHTIFIANPNAPTGLALSISQIEKIVKSNSNNVVVIDEAYVEFGANSCISLIHKYDNLLVSHTFSKSRSLAGARLGYGIGNKNLIKDLNLIKYSTNPYNVNSMTMALGLGVLHDENTVRKNCEIIIQNRKYLSDELNKLNFDIIESKTNFIFAKNKSISGLKIYSLLKENGVFIRRFDIDKIRDYIRITIGTKKQMDEFLKILKRVLEIK